MYYAFFYVLLISYRYLCLIECLATPFRYRCLIVIYIDVLSKPYQYQYLNDTLLMMPYRYFIDIYVLSNILSVSVLYRCLVDVDALLVLYRYRFLIDNLSMLMSYQYLNNIDVLPIPYRCRCCTDTLKLSICLFNIFISISLLQR